MSNEAQGLVRNLAMEAPEKPILMAYANYADESGYCFPGVETIAFDTGYSIPTVVRTRKSLIKGNWLRSKRQFGTSAGTRLNLPKMAIEATDRGDRTKIRPEFEFEEETAGQTQSDQRDLNAANNHPRSDQRDLNVQIREICTTDQRDHLSIRDSSVNPSVDTCAREKTERMKKELKTETKQPLDTQRALNLIAELDYGKHRRPTQQQARELGDLVEAAFNEHGLSEVEIRRHCRATLNKATHSAVAYLRGGLDPKNLPIPTSRKDPELSPENKDSLPANKETVNKAKAAIRKTLQKARETSSASTKATKKSPERPCNAVKGPNPPFLQGNKVLPPVSHLDPFTGQPGSGKPLQTI